jgi:hypothetical protein
MVMRHNGQTVVDIQSMKARGQKISMLYVTTLDEVAAAAAAVSSRPRCERRPAHVSFRSSFR